MKGRIHCMSVRESVLRGFDCARIMHGACIMVSAHRADRRWSEVKSAARRPQLLVLGQVSGIRLSLGCDEKPCKRWFQKSGPQVCSSPGQWQLAARKCARTGAVKFKYRTHERLVWDQP